MDPPGVFKLDLVPDWVSQKSPDWSVQRFADYYYYNKDNNNTPLVGANSFPPGTQQTATARTTTTTRLLPLNGWWGVAKRIE